MFLAPCDIEFVKRTGMVCRVGFQFLSSLAGQGDIYLQLTKSFVEDVDAMDYRPSPLPSGVNLLPTSCSASTPC